jgi:4-amino-4-deoxy-L-arabinose transferase-like glycosyltransferase
MISSQFEISLTNRAATRLRAATKLGDKALFLSIFIVYAVLRLVAWQQAVLVEDHDSLVYLDQIKIFRTLDLKKIINMGGFTTQFYPFSAALLSWPGWSVETSARLCSMFFSSLLFLSVWGIGKRIAGANEVALGLLIVAFSPVLISFSISILSEPAYVAIIYAGFWVFWTQYKNPKLWKAGLLGVIFGLGFLTRLEGLLHLFVIPFLQGVMIFFGPRKEDSLKRFAAWTTVFVLPFALLIGVQVWRVSAKFGYWAIDERQVWTVARQILEDKSYEEQMNGLNFSPSQTNLDYIRDHPEVQAQAASRVIVKETIKKSGKTIAVNVDDLWNKLSNLIGPLLFFLAGLFALYKSRRERDGILVLAFIACNSIAPLLYQVQMRYVAVLAPLVMLVAGIGIVYLAKSLASLWERKRALENLLCLVFLLALMTIWAQPLYRLYASPPTFNGEYSPQSLREPVRIVKSIAEKELLRPPILSARKGYLIYYAEAKPEALPYTNIQGLTRFCELNRVDFLFLEHRLIQAYPFLVSFNGGNPPAGFMLLHRGTDAFGGKLELYRFQSRSPGANQSHGSSL